MNCARCGYLREFHDVAGHCPGMKTAKWADPGPVDPALWREIMARDAAARLRAIEDDKRTWQPPVVPPPLIPARVPLSAAEYAGFRGKQAVGLGRKAIDRGWSVTPLYWMAGSGAEGCGVWILRNDLRALATWDRAAGLAGGKSGWRADIAYAWRTGAIPTKLTHTDLEAII
jgi:hypothetical protein